MAGEEDNKETFFSTLSTFQRQGTMVDVIVEVENEQFPSHRLVLSIYSLYFRAMFSSRMREEREELVKLSVLSADQFRLVHDYMYGRLCERIEGLELQTALQLAEAANYLDMKSLLEICGDVVIKEISVDNLVKVEPDLYEACCRFNLLGAKAHIDSLYITQLCMSSAVREAFTKLPGNRLIKYANSDRLRLRNEMKLVEFLRRWYELRDESEEDLSILHRSLTAVRIGLLHTEDDIYEYISLCQTVQVPISQVSPWPDSFQLRTALVSQPFWRLLTDSESSELTSRCKPRALQEVCCHVTHQDSTFTLRFCHISGPKGVDYTTTTHQNGIHPRFCMTQRPFISTRLHRITSMQWHCCSRDGYFFFYVEQPLEPASQAPGVMCVFDSAREVFHCFDGVTPLLSMMSMASSGDALYIMGGRTAEGSYNFRSVDSIFAFNFRQFGWSRLPKPTLPQPAHSQAAATLDDNVYICGGICHGYNEEDARVHNLIVGRPLDCLWRLPADASTVTVLAPMLQPRYQHRLLACRQYLYAVGGVCEGLVSGNQQGGIERYDPAVDQWTAMDGIWLDGTIPPAVRFFGPVIALESDGCIYAMGRGSSPPTVGLWQFDPAELKWNMIQLLNWDKQQMLTAFIPWSCLSASNDQNDSSVLPSKIRRRNHEHETERWRLFSSRRPSMGEESSYNARDDRTHRLVLHDGTGSGNQSPHIG